jgi:hypothetical protein
MTLPSEGMSEGETAAAPSARGASKAIKSLRFAMIGSLVEKREILARKMCV